MAALALSTCHPAPVLAVPLSADQRALVSRIQADARAIQSELGETQRDLAAAHTDAATARAENAAAVAQVDALRAEKTRTEVALLRSRLLGWPLALALGVVAGLLLSRVAKVAAFLAKLAAVA